jgi:Ca2+-binding EF-hand superfamily protein
MFEDLINNVDSYIDFSEYDMNNDGYIDFVTVIHSGPG